MLLIKHNACSQSSKVLQRSGRNSNLSESELSDDEYEKWCTIKDPTLKSKTPELKKKMENENLDSGRKECQTPDFAMKSDGSGDGVAENMEFGPRTPSPER